MSVPPVADVSSSESWYVTLIMSGGRDGVFCDGIGSEEVSKYNEKVNICPWMYVLAV